MTEEFAVPTEDDVMDRRVPGEVLLDENVLAEGHAGFSLGGFEVLYILALIDSPAILCAERPLRTDVPNGERYSWLSFAACHLSRAVPPFVVISCEPQ